MSRTARWLALVIRGFGDRGRRAESPTDIPLVGWRDIALRVWRNARADNLNILAAGIAFYAFLALLPLIASTVMIYGLVTEPGQVVEDMRKLIVLVPATAQRLVMERLVAVIIEKQVGAIPLLLALLLTIYGGARSARAISAAINLIYGEGDERGFARRWGVPLLLAVGSAALMLLALTTIAVFGYVDRLMPESTPLGWFAVKAGFWLLVAAAIGAGSAALYRYVPARRHARWKWVVPGALVATILWLLATFAFGVYIANFSNYDLTYGALAAVVILQLWIYLSAFILLLGAKLNAEIELQTTRDTTVGPSRPAGRREAASADHVGVIPIVAVDLTGSKTR